MGISESCKHEMESTVMPQYSTDELGVPISIVYAAKENKCKHCGLVTHSFPYPERLVAAAAVYRCKIADKLVGREIKFLRKALGWTASKLAQHLGTTAETVSRWENDKAPMSLAAEKLFRLSVFLTLKERAPAVRLTVEELSEMKIKAVRASMLIPRMCFMLVQVQKEKEVNTSEEYSDTIRMAA